MNRKQPTAFKTTDNNSTSFDKKRKLRSKSKDPENETSNLDESDYFSDQDSDNQSSRKSKRLQVQSGPQSPNKTGKTLKILEAKIPAGLSNDRKQLNGAQFVAAAAAGNFNVSASIGTTSITIDSNSNMDLNHLSQNVEMLNSTLKQHSLFLKQLNNSIEKLSHKIDAKVSTSSSSATGYIKKQGKSQMRRVTKNAKSLVTLEKESKEEIEEIQPDSEDEDEQTETINEPVQQQAAQKATQKASLENSSNESVYEIESINPNSTKTATAVCEGSAKEGVEQTETPIDIEVRNQTSGSNDGNGLVELRQETQLVKIEDAITSGGEEKQEVVANDNGILNKNDFQTVKLTNTMLEMEKESAGQEGKNNFYSSDSSKSDEDEDYEEEEDDADEDGNYKEGRPSAKSPSGHKSSGGTKAILNKTKIDTEFISKLIENKDPNDKRYDPNEINKLRLLSHSYQNFAVKLLMRLFDEEEIIGRNVYGRNYSGDKTFMKQPLDSDRINFIKETVLRLTRTNNPELAWASCVIAMNRKMVDINNKFIKQNSKK